MLQMPLQNPTLLSMQCQRYSAPIYLKTTKYSLMDVSRNQFHLAYDLQGGLVGGHVLIG